MASIRMYAVIIKLFYNEDVLLQTKKKYYKQRKKGEIMKILNRKFVNQELKKMEQMSLAYAYGVAGIGKSTSIRHFLQNEKQLSYQWLNLQAGDNLEDIWRSLFQKTKIRMNFEDCMKFIPVTNEDFLICGEQLKKKCKIPSSWSLKMVVMNKITYLQKFFIN